MKASEEHFPLVERTPVVAWPPCSSPARCFMALPAFNAPQCDCGNKRHVSRRHALDERWTSQRINESRMEEGDQAG